MKSVHDKNDRLVAMVYDGDGNRIFQLNYNLHTDDDWKGNSGNSNGNNKDNSGCGNKGNNSGNGTGSKKGILTSLESFFGLDDGTEEADETMEVSTASNATARKSNGNKDKDKGNNGNDKNNGKGNGNGNTSTGDNNDNNGNANGNTNNTGGSQNQSGILFPIDGEVSELEVELIGMIKTTGKEKNYELVEYVNDVNREHVEVLMELNINGIMDTAYSYGNERLTNERFTEWTGYYTYDPRGSVTGVTDSKGMIWQSYRYDVSGDLTFGKPQYNNVYSYNAESYNPNMESQYLRARYYNVPNGNFLMEDLYLGNIIDPLTLNRYNYVKSSPLNYIDPSGRSEASLRGVRAHTVLETFLKVVYMPAKNVEVETEKLVYNMTFYEELWYDSDLYGGGGLSTAYASFKKGRLDIEYIGILSNEVYEIKPYSWVNEPNLSKGKEQRQNYIDALVSMGERINPWGNSLNLIVNTVILPDPGEKDSYFKYYTMPDHPGMIFWSAIKTPPEYSLEEAIETARSKAGIEVCEDEVLVTVKTPGVVWDQGNLPAIPNASLETAGEAITIAGTVAALYELIVYLFELGVQVIPLL